MHEVWKDIFVSFLKTFIKPAENLEILVSTKRRKLALDKSEDEAKETAIL